MTAPPLVIALLVALVAATPFIHTFRRKSDWARHPGGQAGVLRDNIVIYAPTAGCLTAALLALSLKSLGIVSTTAGFWWIAAGLIALLAISALAGFLPPVMAARQRLVRLRSKPEA
jgi:hypothetical protein